MQQGLSPLRKLFELFHSLLVTGAQFVPQLGLLGARTAAHGAQPREKVTRHARLGITIIPFWEKIILSIDHRHPEPARQGLIEVLGTTPGPILSASAVVEVELECRFDRIDDQRLGLLIEQRCGTG